MMGPKAGRPIPALTEADEKRFWAKVELPDPETGCMAWTGVKIRCGYGRFWLGGSMYLAHRVAWTLVNGPIPPGLVIDHLCRNRACVNPLHLEVVTNRENTVRGELWQREVTNCPAGHAYDEANTYRNPRGSRRCRTCQREHERAYRLRKRLASAGSTGQLPMPTTPHTGLDAS